MTHCQPFSLPRLPTLAALLVGLSGGLTALEATAAPPAPIAPIITSAATRFTDNSNGTVTDSMTGLIWLKDANCVTVSPKAWAAALTAIATLASPSCGLSDGSTTGQWRLPSRNELQSLIDYTTINPALPAGHPFTGVQSSYWSSTASTIYAPDTRYAWLVPIHDGKVYWVSKTHDAFVWPVRGGR
ncbi:MAG: DUF1566 domain-containing protein [Candidatus Contendobacter sp.]|nr:DUF1566 domain-containing protein [Candidatus Contendobacter sp.]